MFTEKDILDRIEGKVFYYLFNYLFMITVAIFVIMTNIKISFYFLIPILIVLPYIGERLYKKIKKREIEIWRKIIFNLQVDSCLKKDQEKLFILKERELFLIGIYTNL